MNRVPVNMPPDKRAYMKNIMAYVWGIVLSTHLLPALFGFNYYKKKFPQKIIL